MRKIFDFIKRRKWQLLVGVLMLGAAGYFVWPKIFPAKATVRYVSGQVTKGALTTSISGTGQISATNQVDVKAKATGDLVYLNAPLGQQVKAGTLIARLDTKDAAKTVRDAQANLQSAQLSLEKLKKSADSLTLLQAEDALSSAQESQQQAQANLQKAYDDGFTDISNAFLDLPTVMSGLQNLLYGYDINNMQNNMDWYANQAVTVSDADFTRVRKYHDDANDSYNTARAAYDTNFDAYKATSSNASSEEIENLILKTYNTSKLVSNAIKSANNYLDLVQDILSSDAVHKSNIPAVLATQQNSLDSYTGKVNTQVTSLLSIKQSIDNTKNSIKSYDRTIAEKTASLADVKAGVDPLDLRAQELSVQQRVNALSDAREKLADYYVKAPFDGIVAKCDVKKGDSISASTAIATLMTNQKTAVISLNEVDIAKVKVGQRVTLTFDAVDGLELTGEVAEVDSLGTTTQGVVSYSVTIAFDVQDDRIKPGMSVSANIILDSKPDVLMVLSSAIKTQNGTSYVEQLINGVPVKKDVQIGSSNDTMTEITSGLSEGENIITQKITVSAANNTTASTKSSTSKSQRNDMGGGGPMMFMR